MRPQGCTANMTFLQLFEHLHEPERKSGLSPVRFCEALGTDLRVLAVRAKVDLDTLREDPDAEAVQGFMREALRVIRASSDLSGDLEKALYWFRNFPIAELGYQMPEQSVADGRGEIVLRYIALLEAGSGG